MELILSTMPWKTRLMVSTLQYRLYFYFLFFNFALSTNLIYFCYPMNEMWRVLTLVETLFSPTKDGYMVSFDVVIDESINFTNIGVVIRRCCLLILCVSTLIKCETRHIGEVLGINLKLQKASKSWIYDF